MYRSRIIIAIALAIHSTVFGVSLPVSEDTSTTRRATLTPTIGRAKTLTVNAKQIALIRFGLAGLPSTITASNLVSARLRVFVTKVTTPGALLVRPVKSEWSEESPLNTPAPQLGSPFAPDEPVPEISDPLGAISNAKAKQFHIVDVTSAVQAWLTVAPDGNYGFAIVAENGTANIQLGSKEGAGSGYPAELEIEVDTVSRFLTGDPSNPTIAPSAFGSDSLTSNEIATNAVGPSELQFAAVGTDKLDSFAVTEGKIANGAVTTNKIQGLSITSALLANGAVTPGKNAPEVGIYWFQQDNEVHLNGTSGWNLRQLNAGQQIGNGDIQRLGNTIVLKPGTYFVEAEASAYRTLGNQIVLRDVTFGVDPVPSSADTKIVGLSQRADGSGSTTTLSSLKGILEVTGPERSYQLWHYIATGSLGPADLGFATDTEGEMTNPFLSLHAIISIVRIR